MKTTILIPIAIILIFIMPMASALVLDDFESCYDWNNEWGKLDNYGRSNNTIFGNSSMVIMSCSEQGCGSWAGKISRTWNLPQDWSEYYAISLWMKHGTTGSCTPLCNPYIRLSISGDNGSNFYSGYVGIPNTDWQKYSFNFTSTMPAARKITLDVDGCNNGGMYDLYLDQMTLEKNPSLPVFYESFENAASLSAEGCISCSVTSFGEGIKGNASYFGAGSALTYPSSSINKNEGTISFWIKPNYTDYLGHGFFDFGDIGSSASLGIFSNYKTTLYYEVREDDFNMQQIARTALYQGKWTNIAATYKFNNGGINDTMILYVDGRPAGLSGYNISFNPTDASFRIGYVGFYRTAADSYIDELKIYDYARTPAEIASDYSKTVNGFAKLPSTGRIRINNSKIYVNYPYNAPFVIKGAGYQPTPIGESPDRGYDIFSHPELWKRDFSLLRKMNITAIRTWGNVNNSLFLTDAYNYGNRPIYVIMGYWMNCNENYADLAVRQKYIDDFRNYVKTYKDYDAVLMWAIGNENNLCYSGNMADFYSLANEMAKAAYEEEGLSYHPVAIINGHLYNIGDSSKKADDLSLDYIDVWGINAYPGETFGNYFNDYKSLSSKPFFISEYGTDSFDNNEQEENEDVQAEWDFRLWEEIESSNALGGTLMEYSDEWWKDNTGSVNDHDDGGYSTSQWGHLHPDDFSNEEWWGMMRPVKNGSLDIMHPRKVYYVLRDEFRGYNNPPVLSKLNDMTATEGDLVSINPAGSDPDKDDLIFKFSSPFNASGKWQTDIGDEGVYTVRVTASDGTLKDSEEFEVTINPGCAEKWVAQDTSCNASDKKLVYYADENNCNTTKKLPSDNGTYASCDYCTPNWQCSEYGECQPENKKSCSSAADSNHCYADTGLNSDEYSGNYSEFDQYCDYQSLVECNNDEDCGNPEYTGGNYCKDGNVYRNYREPLCLNPGTLDSSCSYTDTPRLQQECPGVCEDGRCIRFYEFRTVALDYNTENFIPSTIEVDGITKTGEPPQYKAIFSVRANKFIKTYYSCNGYKPDTDYIYLDENLANCIQGVNCNKESNGYSTSCKWNSNYTDFTCTVTKSGFNSVFLYNPGDKTVRRVDYLEKK